MSKKRDEKTKLLATLLNTCAGTSFSVGVVAPIVAVLLNIGDAGVKIPISALFINSIFWISAAIVLHLCGRKILDGLSD